MGVNELLVKQFERDRARKVEELSKAISDLKTTLGEAKTRIRAGLSLNSLGIVQGMGSTIDRLVGELAEMDRIRKYWEF